MVLLTLIARVTDGLLLAASMEDEQVRPRGGGIAREDSRCWSHLMIGSML